MTVVVDEVLPRAVWSARADAHAARVDRWTVPHLERRRRGEKDPVHDFLFTYYAHSPAALRRWHPGWGVRLADAPEYADAKGYDAGTVGRELLLTRLRLVRQLHTLLVATAGRPPTLGCFGLHEWAMVHRAREHGRRHEVPLRLGPDGTDAVVEGHRIACSHFDAFRFFSPSARGLNRLSPGRDDRASYEQPGCLHAGMDLYGRHAVRLSPLIHSELVADTFELAVDLRQMDMRASPYDLSGYGYEAICIETRDGKEEYVRLQRAYAARGAVLRQRLVTECERLLRGAEINFSGQAIKKS